MCKKLLYSLIKKYKRTYLVAEKPISKPAWIRLMYRANMLSRNISSSHMCAGLVASSSI